MTSIDRIRAALREDPAAGALLARGLRPRVGVSACLLGERVRYDGDHRRSEPASVLLPALLELCPLCPEVAIGLGVPRPTIQRVRLHAGREVVRGVDDPGLDVTAALDAYAQQVAGQEMLHGYVFKARSPSCGPGNAPLLDEQDRELGRAWGLYAEALHRIWPGMPLCDEETLAADPLAFVLACYRYAATG